MATRKEILELAEALNRAKNQAATCSDINDDGTCNLDMPQIYLSGWRPEEVQQAFDKTNARCHIQKHGKSLVIDIYGYTTGQASRRTRMAELVCESLRNDGYEAFVYYQID